MERKFWEVVANVYGSTIEDTDITSFEQDLGFSSFQLVQLIVELEETFEVTISFESMKFEIINNPEQLLNLLIDIKKGS